MKYYSKLLSKIKKSKANIGIIGLGYVGLPLAILFCKKKFNVVGFDIDKKKIKLLNKRISYLSHIDNRKIKSNFKKNFQATKNFKNIKFMDIIILCIPTPLNKSLKPEMKHIIETMKSIKKYLNTGQLIILESSTYPGSTRKIIDEMFIKKKFKTGSNFFVGYSPEREDPSNKKFKLENIPKLCSGVTNKCLNLTINLYSKIVNKTIKMKNIETTEFTKLFENTYRNVNIALVNEIKILCKKLNINVFDMINAAKTKPFGFQEFYPGPGVGGHCIPVDPYYLSWIAKKNNTKLNFVELSGNINHNMPKWIVNQSLKKIKKKKNINSLLIGIAYKRNVADTRESPAFDFINILKKKKVNVTYHDPFVDKTSSRKLIKQMSSKKLTADLLKKQDIVYILTNHSNINYELIKKHSKKIIDTRNVFKKETSSINIL